MSGSEADRALRRLERDALLVCAVLAGIAALVAPARFAAAASVVAGGLLVAVSYGTIKAGASGLAAAVQGTAGGDATAERRAVARRRIAWALLLVVGRYALLGLMAYVMMTRLRLHPIGLLAGASSMAAAAALEALRILVGRGAREP